VLSALVEHQGIAFGPRARGIDRTPELLVLLWDVHIVDALFVPHRIGVLLGLRRRAEVDHGPYTVGKKRLPAAVVQTAELIGANEGAAPHAPTVSCRQAAEVSDIEARIPRERAAGLVRVSPQRRGGCR